MAGTVSFTDQKPNKRAKGGPLGKLVVTWLSTTGGVANSANIPFNGKILRAVTNPDGTDAPTDDYDITLTDEDGLDLAQGVLADRDTANSEQVVPLIGDGTITTQLVAYVGLLVVNIAAAGSEKAGVVTIFYE